MKKAIILMLAIAFCLSFTGCKGPDNNDSLGNNNAEIINRLYLTCSVYDIDEKYLYSNLIGADEIPQLVIGQDYRLKLHCGPGSCFVPYEGIGLEYNDEDISVTTFADCIGEEYKLRGLKDCENTVLKFTDIASLKYAKPIECIITFSFK